VPYVPQGKVVSFSQYHPFFWVCEDRSVDGVDPLFVLASVVSKLSPLLVVTDGREKSSPPPPRLLFDGFPSGFFAPRRRRGTFLPCFRRESEMDASSPPSMTRMPKFL